LEKPEIVREILSYLLDNPKARDTIDGIVEWWLLEQKIRKQVDMVKEVLADLVNKGLILEVKGADLRIHYRINAFKHKEIKSLIGGNRD
jgi:hypothetical protein